MIKVRTGISGLLGYRSHQVEPDVTPTLGHLSFLQQFPTPHTHRIYFSDDVVLVHLCAGVRKVLLRDKSLIQFLDCETSTWPIAKLNLFEHSALKAQSPLVWDFSIQIRFTVLTDDSNMVVKRSILTGASDRVVEDSCTESTTMLHAIDSERLVVLAVEGPKTFHSSTFQFEYDTHLLKSASGTVIKDSFTDSIEDSECLLVPAADSPFIFSKQTSISCIASSIVQ